MVARGDANLAAYLRHLATSAAGGVVAEEPGLLLFAGGHNYPGAYTNGVIRCGALRRAARDVLESARRFFGARRRGFAVWVREHADGDLEAAAREAGLWQRPPLQGNPGIAIDHRLPDPVLPPRTRLHRVSTDAAARDYLGVVAAGYGVGDVPLQTMEAILFSLASLRSPRVAAFVAYRDGRAVSGCMAYVADGAAGLQWGATRPEARGSGLGTATFTAACNAGFDLGAACATGQSSAVGTPIWVRAGFEVVTRYRRYLASPRRPGRTVPGGLP
jgi:GNAT superfamily N-acetyltransferase